MKKLLSALLVLVMVLSMSTAVFAANEPTGYITVTNATIDETYKLFGTDGTTDNTYFTYNKNTGSATKKEGVNDAELIKYLTDLVAAGTYTTAAAPIVATTDEVKFENLPYGYYLITSTLGTTVTINSNTPNAKVIDKNQKPGNGFDKLIQTGVDVNGDPIWGESNSANIGDEITYKIAFEATNYDEKNKIKYYQIHDEKGDAIWAEFNSFEVYVGGVKLDRGYYLSQGGVNTDNWEFLGDWSAIPEADRDRNDAQWYLVHLDYDKFRITIPWLENHTVTDVKNDAGVTTSYTVNFPENAASKYDSPIQVEVIYKAVVEATAAIGDTSHGNRYNKASASWTSEHETDSTKPEEVVTYVYGIGLLKDDIATRENLAGAKFRIYKDAACTVPVYVIPTKIDGVYIVDSFGSDAEKVSGIKQETTRKLYEAFLADYLKDKDGNTIPQDNLVVSQVNGKLAVLGLEAGTYYLKEVEAPAGYNALTQPVELKAGEDIRPFSIFADKDGNVADIQAEDGVHTENRFDLTHTVVHNSKGVVLPSTGGEGTVWLITIGALLSIGFAVFLITQKKMSVYTD